MNGINPQTGKRIGKFLWRESDSEREDYLRQLKSKIASGYYSSEMVLASLVDDLAPAVSSSIDVEVAG